MSLPNLVGDWQVGEFSLLGWSTPYDLADTFLGRASILTQDTSPIRSKVNHAYIDAVVGSDAVALTGWYAGPDVSELGIPMVGLLDASFVRFFVGEGTAGDGPWNNLRFIEAQFLAESPIVYFTDGGQRRVEDRGYEQIKGTVQWMHEQYVDSGVSDPRLIPGWFGEDMRNVIFRRKSPPHGVITARRP